METCKEHNDVNNLNESTMNKRRKLDSIDVDEKGSQYDALENEQNPVSVEDQTAVTQDAKELETITIVDSPEASVPTTEIAFENQSCVIIVDEPDVVVPPLTASTSTPLPTKCRPSLSSTCDSTTSPTITIKFSSSVVANSYKSRFLDFLQQFPQLCVLSSTASNNTDPNRIEIIEKAQAPPLLVSPPQEDTSVCDLFTVDTTPDVSRKPTLSYLSKFSVNGSGAGSLDATKSDSPQTSTSICYNCNGAGHFSRDCPKGKPNYRPKNTLRRYHNDSDDRYSNVPPVGVISAKLREALGLRKHDLPSYIYGMRLLGYPPGWMEEAKIHSSQLEMFDSSGRKVMTTKMNRTKTVVDPDRIVEYPGYNGHLGHFKDEYKRHGTPPYSKKYGKEAMIAYLDRLHEEETITFKRTEEENLNSAANIIDDSSQSLTVESQLPQNIDEDSLTELEVQKQALLRQLSEDTKLDANLTNTDTVANDTKEQIFNSTTLEESCIAEEKSVKTTLFGTPILKSSSSYSCLPHVDNFAKDVGPLINFENLPNATGKYEQMTDVLQKVRTILKRSTNNISS